MPTLEFKGRNIIWNHHLSVPYHSIDEISNLHIQKEKANGNIIIEGDNLLALKALLPQYSGRIKCIYIDPPYNTGNDISENKGCDEKQFKDNVTPITSHPNRYWHLNAMKFISLWELALKIGAKLYLVNYSKKGTKYENEILLMDVVYVDKNKYPPVKTLDFAYSSREAFSKWFRELNKRGST